MTNWPPLLILIVPFALHVVVLLSPSRPTSVLVLLVKVPLVMLIVPVALPELVLLVNGTTGEPT